MGRCLSQCDTISYQTAVHVLYTHCYKMMKSSASLWTWQTSSRNLRRELPTLRERDDRRSLTHDNKNVFRLSPSNRTKSTFKGFSHKKGMKGFTSWVACFLLTVSQLQLPYRLSTPCVGPLQPFWLDSVQYVSPAAALKLLATVVLQDVWVVLPELLSYNVTVIVLHLPPAASHRHILLLFIW